jgi:ArsR family transcriptional regulator
MTTFSHFHKLENMKSENVIVALGALAQESRLEAFRLLVRRGPEGYTPGDLAQRLGIPAPTLSFHLKELQRAQLIAARREGRFLHYSANFETMQSVIDFLTDKCCTLASAQCGADCAPVTRAKRRRA